MKILKVFEEAELVLVDLEVNLGKKTQSSPTLCIKMEGKIIPLHSAHEIGRAHVRTPVTSLSRMPSSA